MNLDPESEGHFTVLRPWHRLHTRSDVAVVGKARQIPCRPSLSISIPANSSHRCVTGTESARKLGKFLVMSQFQGSVHSSALFLTAAAQNLLCLKLATEMGVVISSPWVTWVKGALAPALVGMLVTPLLMFKVSPFPLPPLCSHLLPLVWCSFFSWVILRGLLTLTCLSVPYSSLQDQSSYVSIIARHPSRRHSKQ